MLVPFDFILIAIQKGNFINSEVPKTVSELWQNEFIKTSYHLEIKQISKHFFISYGCYYLLQYPTLVSKYTVIAAVGWQHWRELQISCVFSNFGSNILLIPFKTKLLKIEVNNVQ